MPRTSGTVRFTKNKIKRTSGIIIICFVGEEIY